MIVNPPDGSELSQQGLTAPLRATDAERTPHPRGLPGVSGAFTATLINASMAFKTEPEIQ